MKNTIDWFAPVIMLTVEISFEARMNAKQIEKLIAQMADISAGEADQRIRPLREAGILPIAGRGRHAPPINALHASYMVLAIVSRRAVDSGAVAARAAGLKAANSPFTAETSLGPIIAYLLQNPAETWMRRLMIAEDGSRAWMVSDFRSEGEQWLWAEPNVLKELRDSGCQVTNFGRSQMSRWFEIGGAALAQLGLEMQQDIESGWIDPDTGIEAPELLAEV